MESIQDAIDALDEKVTTAVASGVQSFGGKTGAITLKATASTNGAVNLTMNNNELQGAVVGLKSAAYVATTAFDAAGSANKALIDAKAYADSLMEWADFA